MSEYNFHVNNETQKLQIIPTEIYGRGDVENPTLIIPVKIICRPSNYNEQKRSYNLMAIEGSLTFNGFNYKLSKALNFKYNKVNREIDLHYNLEFEIDEYKISKIEEKRKNDLQVQLAFIIHIGYYETILLNTVNSETVAKDFISDFDYMTLDARFDIPHSHWVSKVLPALGHKRIRIIEIPNPSDLLVEELSNSLNELNLANEYFLKGDYDKTVGHCRSAIDPIRRKLPELKNEIESSSEKDWINKIITATDVWLDVVVKQTHHFTSKSHHIPSVGHFSRSDAEIIYMMTTGIIAYAGKLDPVKYKKKGS